MKVQTAAEFLAQHATAGSKRSGFSHISTGKGGQSRKKPTGGKREDLNKQYFRSMWEANFARYLNWCIANKQICLPVGQKIHSWKFEPEEFEFYTATGKPYKTGARFYIPDFQVFFGRKTEQYPDGYIWIEVKGFMDANSKTKLSRFARCFPDEKLIVVAKKEYSQIKGLYSHVIPHWESMETT